MKINLAFDIERSGATDQYDTIAIGASVLNENFIELDSLLLLGYVETKQNLNQDVGMNFGVKTLIHLIP